MSSRSQFSLFATRRFLPLFITQFMGAFNDNLFKSSLVTLITFRLAAEYGLNGSMLITEVAGLFILPYFLFSSLAGQLADKYDKTKLIHYVKLWEIVLMALTAVAFSTMRLWWLVLLLFLMGAQSTFFGPLKYGILPQLLPEDELVAGNGLINGGTNVAILTGTLVGGLLILSSHGRLLISIGIIGVAMVGYIASLFIPRTPACSPELKIDHNLFRSTWQVLVYPVSNRPVFLSILGISWFWFIGSVFLAQFPSYAKDAVGGNEQISTLFLMVFSVGVACGSTFCNKLLGGRVSGKYLPYSLCAMSLFVAALSFSSVRIGAADELIGAMRFIQQPTALPLLASMFLMAAAGGTYSVPMYAIMQSCTPQTHTARVIASLNIYNALYMVAAAGISMAMISCGFSVIEIFLAMGLLNLANLPLARKLASIVKPVN